MSAITIIYIHGFNSSPQSLKAQLTEQFLASEHLAGQYQLLVPALSHWPAEAIVQLQALIDQQQGAPVLLLGSSLGGYYSLWLAEQNANCRAVLVNPAIYPHRLLRDWLGANENLYTHEQYQLTPEHLAQLEAIETEQLTGQRYLLLTQTADETLDYREGVEKLAGQAQFVQPGGNHGFAEFYSLLPAICAFAHGRLELPEPKPLPSGYPEN